MITNYEMQDVAQPGQVHDAAPHLIISVNNTSNTLEFGDFVVNDSGTIVKWNGDDYANKKPVGVVLYNALEIENKPTVGSKIPIISRGAVWISVDENDAGFANIKKGEIAYLNAISGNPTGFIDDVITNEKVGKFVEDALALNEGSYIVPIELKLFAKNTNSLVIVEGGNDDPPLPSSGSVIYYNAVDDTLRSSSTNGYSYLNPKPCYVHSVYNDLNPISNSILPNQQFSDLMVERSNYNPVNQHLIHRFSELSNPTTYNGMEYVGKYSIYCKVFITISCVLKNSTNEEVIAIQVSGVSGVGGSIVPEEGVGGAASRFYMHLVPDQKRTANVNFVTSLNPNAKFFIKAANALNNSELDVDVVGYNIICEAI